MNKGLIITCVLAVFLVSISIGSVTATHTLTVGKYTVKLTDAQYNDLKQQQDTNTAGRGYHIKTGKYYTYKKPVYKYKKVKKTKWVYKDVLTGYDKWAPDFSWSKSDTYDTADKYWKSKKWKYCGGHTVKVTPYYQKYYTTFKKKGKGIVKKKVKAGYKKAKDPIYADIAYSPGGMADKGVIVTIYSEKYFEKHDDYIKTKVVTL